MRVARRVERATLQAVSSFINALRERVSMAKRSGGRATRRNSSFINGASFSPNVLVAVLNIFRIYFNWFEARPYITATTEGSDLVEVTPSTTLERVPGSADVIEVEKRRRTRPVLRTPAMRHGIQPEMRDASGHLTMQSLHAFSIAPGSTRERHFSTSSTMAAWICARAPARLLLGRLPGSGRFVPASLSDLPTQDRVQSVLCPELRPDPRPEMGRPAGDQAEGREPGQGRSNPSLLIF